MSRFANPLAERRVDLGPCECDGSPHDADEAFIRGELSGSEVGGLQAVPTNDEQAAAEAVAGLVLRWNLRDGDADVPVSAEALRMLKAPTLAAISEAVSAVIESSISVPNASGAPSAASSRGSASPARTRKQPHTT